MKLIDNQPNQDKKDYLLKLKDFIDIPITCIKCKNVERKKNLKIRKKRKK